MTYDGQVKLVDFGVAKVAGAGGLTETGVVKGKMSYMAPEQALSLPVDRRADVFAVGIMLWEAIAQERFVPRGEQEIATIQKRVSGDVRSIREAAPGAPPELLAICEKAVARDREGRYATAAEFQDALETYLQKTDPGAGQKQLGAVIGKAFTEERQAMRARIEAQLKVLAETPSKVSVVDVPPTEADVSGKHRAISGVSKVGSITSGATAVTKVDAPAPKGRRLWPLGVAAALLAAGAWIALARKQPEHVADATSASVVLPSAAPSTSAAPSPATSATTSAPPRTVRIHVTAKPPAARVSLDGAPAVAPPLEVSVPSDGKTHHLVVHAPGYTDETRELTADRDVDLEIALSVAPATGGTVKRPNPAASGNHARPLDDKDPYSQ